MTDTWTYLTPNDTSDTIPDEWVWERLRNRRNTLLAACDWAVLPDQPAARSSAWMTYRQALRDLPENTTDPRQAVWPTPPDA
jgi:hypothetical protein